MIVSNLLTENKPERHRDNRVKGIDAFAYEKQSVIRLNRLIGSFNILVNNTLLEILCEHRTSPYILELLFPGQERDV